MLALLLTTWLSTPAHAEDFCRPPEYVLNEIEEYVGLFELEYAKEAIEAAQVSYACSAPAEPQTLARILLADAVIKVFGEDAEGAKLSFAAANRVAPDVWNANYGEDNKALYDQASAATPGSGTIKLLPHFPEQVLWVDGQPMVAPVEVPAGMHLVQAGIDGQANASFARLVRVNDGQTNIVKTGLSAPGAEPDPPPEVVTPPPDPVEPVVRCGAGTELVDGVCTVVAPPPVVEPTVVPPDGPKPQPLPTEDAFAKYLTKKGTSKKRRRTAAFVGQGITSLVMFGGAAGGRLYYDHEKNQWEGNTQTPFTDTSDALPMALTVNALQVGSILFGGLSLINLSKALNTPSDEKIAAERAK